MSPTAFKKLIWSYHKTNRRNLPWRSTRNPYIIFVSEIMLQQTQVSRVMPKYESFIKKFPTFKALADAPLRDVLAEWKGLGYNRRGLNLKRAAEIIIKEHKGKLPKDPKILTTLPGIGPNTAGSLLAFAHNIPIPFIETNIRSVYLHFFFPGKKNIHDRDILPLIEKTLDYANAREWYYALMDYGVMLKSKNTNPSRRSLHHAKQSPFKGSHREMRSKVLSYVLENPQCPAAIIAKSSNIKVRLTQEILRELTHEGFIRKKGTSYFVD